MVMRMEFVLNMANKSLTCLYLTSRGFRKVARYINELNNFFTTKMDHHWKK